jgi:hypothetical protein
MSDYGKAVSYAEMLGASQVLQLRWEGSGDSSHAAGIIEKLKSRKYTGTDQFIRFHATVNLYEGADDPNATVACENLSRAISNAHADQTVEINFRVDLARPPREKPEQTKCHIMFVRNIMLVSEGRGSAVDRKTDLLNLHSRGIRNRANSLDGPGASLRLGISGFPAIKDNKRVKRPDAPVSDLFFGFDQMQAAAQEAGLALRGTPARHAHEDTDTTHIMKNDGSDLGAKTTYYLTFQNPVHI